ncbi:TDP-N-acetylfucosamine:lipid II N-acetylfucosaminyltransferase family protein [Francisella philomiragia]|uniref:TDP-N-acetylfucosamine:lipid II N-acetylfucosaminyltransferase n=1 Tax=Francisella philomiragia TaxID=28110 RepID=UPI001907B291|nr:TDP-N-acetylfucosamine:lipid II N-acetylfucosaminyltransferase [Francisella philomiragia]MBK2297215.1 TDP-N-acetylfucosamine:lipid II N-acetylfucosaminyltransferase [Francisella philomiragia]
MILHIGVNEGKFLPLFYSFLKEHFNIEDHEFYLFGNDKGFENKEKVVFLNSKRQVISLITVMNKADKIILHGLFSPRIDQLLFMQPWLYKKCYWAMWGGDFYFPEKQSFLRRRVIRKIGNLMTYIYGDYLLVKKWYGVKGKYNECLVYPSNLYKKYDVEDRKDDLSTVNIQLGNSATETNNHLDVLEKLYKYKNENIKIFCPLSYGDDQYAIRVISRGKELFGEKFEALTEFLPFDKYLSFLSKIDIGIFGNNRQQAMGNIITLLGLGKKVYITNNTTQWQLFNDLGIEIYNVDEINISLINNKIKKENQIRVKSYFSKKDYIKQLRNLFKD